MVAAFVLTALLASPAIVSPQASASITYDEFQQNAVEVRLRIFNAISADNRAALVREQIARWQKKHAARLTSEQQQVIDAALSLIDADMYDMNAPRRAELQEQMKELEARVRTYFAVEDARQAFTIHGDYIPQ